MSNPITDSVSSFNILFSTKYKIDPREYFDQYSRQWQFYLDSYIGGHQYIKNEEYLHRHEHEYEEEYEFRKKVSCYSNSSDSLIRNIDKHVFGEKIEREGVDKLIDLIAFQNLSRKEVSIDKCFSLVDRLDLALGEIFFLIDAPSDTSQYTDQQVKDLKLKWSAYPILPQYVPALETDKGKITKILIQCKIPTGQYDSNQEQIHIIQIYMDSKKVVYIYDRGKESFETDNKFGQVPILRFMIDEDNNGFGESLLRDIAPMSNSIFNLDSIKSFIGYSNAFPVVGVPITEEFYNIVNKLYGDAILTRKEITIDEKGEAHVKLKKIVGADLRLKRLMAHDANGELKLLNIDTSIIDKIQTDIEYKQKQIQIMASQRVQELIRQSGIAKRYDYLDEVSQLKYLSCIFKNFEMEFWKMFVELSGANVDVDKISLNYPTRFDVVDKDKVVEQLILYKENVSSETAKKEADKVMTDVMLKGYISDDTVDVIKNEIDKESYESKTPEFGEGVTIDEIPEMEIPETPLSEEETTTTTTITE